jgi:cell shape-determining protein MreC
MRNKNKLVKELAVGIGMVLLVFFIEWMGFQQSVRSFFENSLNPLLAKTKQGTDYFFMPFLGLKQQRKAASKLRDLEQAHSRLLARVAQLEDLEKENQSLRELINANQDRQKIVIASPITSYGFPSISLGESQGIQTGKPVLAAKTLVGIIGKTTPHQARVILLPQMEDQYILAKTQAGVEGLVTGDGKNIIMTEIPPDVSLKPGEKVVTVGQNNLPPNLFIGQIQRIIDSPTSPVQTAVIEQLVSFYEVTIVEVMP